MQFIKTAFKHHCPNLYIAQINGINPMRDIFTNNNFYPFEGKIKEHFKHNYDSVFVALMPFLKVERKADDKDVWEKDGRGYYNSYYAPSIEAYFERGRGIYWDEIIKGSGLKGYGELHQALQTSIHALRPVFRREDLTERLIEFTGSHEIWHPEIDVYNTPAKIAIYKAFKLLGKNEVIVFNNDDGPDDILRIDELTESEFIKKIGHGDWHIYSSDKEILFTITWDTFYFLIATDNENMKKIIAANLFEGFLCDDITEHGWEYEDGEIERYLAIEAEQKRLDELQKAEHLNRKTTEDLQQAKKTWWQKLFGK